MDNRLEAARSIDTGSAILAAEIGSSQRGAFVDVVVAEWTLPARCTLTQEAVVLVDARGTVTTWVTQTFAHRQQLHTHTHQGRVKLLSAAGSKKVFCC